MERIIKICIPDIDMNNIDQVNIIINENKKLLNKIANILYNNKEFLEKYKLPNGIVKVNYIEFLHNYQYFK